MYTYLGVYSTTASDDHCRSLIYVCTIKESFAAPYYCSFEIMVPLLYIDMPTKEIFSLRGQRTAKATTV